MVRGKYNYLAFDLGAESGRAELVSLVNNRVSMKEIHRFPNRPVELNGTLYWDFPFLFNEIVASLKKCRQQNIELHGIGVDTWGLDFGLLSEDGSLLSNPVHYRDGRTKDIHNYAAEVPARKIFELTGCEPWPISSLYQLLSMQRDNSPLLKVTETFLHIPDLFNFFLTGEKVSERTNASCSNLMGTDGNWCEYLIESFGLPDIFPKIVPPGTVIGPLSDDLQKSTGYSNTPVIAICGHDTASVVAVVPGEGDDWAFLSCGTWSILGRLSEAPCSELSFLDNGFTNEYTLDSWYTCSNIIGLWIIQELKRQWETGGGSQDGIPWDYARITGEAAESDCVGLIDISSDDFLAPDNMETVVREHLKENGYDRPVDRGGIARVVLESLALEYSYRLKKLSLLTGDEFKTLYMVGGGIKNQLLCELTANACGVKTVAGIEQCTALGNGLTQSIALGHLEEPAKIREIAGNSFDRKVYQPSDSGLWNKKYEEYLSIKK